MFLGVAEELEPDLHEVFQALASQEAVAEICEGGAEGSLGVWLAWILRLLRATETCEGSHWDDFESYLLTFLSEIGLSGVGISDATELREVAELTDIVEICGQRNRAAPHCRDSVGLFFEKSIASGSFFRDVRKPLPCSMRSSRC